MKKILTGFALLITQIVFGQTYNVEIDKASEALQKKDFCNALKFFEQAFTDSTKIGIYDLSNAAVAAANCNSEKLALTWLKKSVDKGLGLNQEEVDYISNDSAYIKLHSYPEWPEIINTIKSAFAKKQYQQKKKSEEWINTINANKIDKKQKDNFHEAKQGFALYYTIIDSLRVPYIVYIPKTYNAIKPMEAIVYLHGGVVSTENFDFENPETASEPIFSVGDIFNSIIIYPFGKKKFGWVAQKKAFENILTIIKRVRQTYNIDSSRIFLGGMSNGGTATFWFASRKPNIFKGFYAFSAMPKLEIGGINFKNLSQGKPFYTINAKDDDVFKYKNVLAIYKLYETEAKDWHFETLESGGHGFIYDPIKGKEIMNNLFKKLLAK